MTVEEIEKIFADEEEEDYDNSPRYKDIKPERKLHPSEEVHLLMLLDNLTGNSGHRLISGADHDIVYLSTIEDIAEKATEEDIMDLRRLGVFYYDEICLALFR